MLHKIGLLLIDAAVVTMSGVVIIGLCIALSTSRISGIIRSKNQTRVDHRP